jgi:hypothetical protein
MTQPRQPDRTRLIRPDLFRDEITGQLTPEERDTYLGISTVADDEGYLVWRPTAIAATIYPYANPDTRVEGLELRAAKLCSVGLLVLLDCRTCAFLPRAKRDLVISGGKQIRQVQSFHLSHSTDRSGSVAGITEGSGTSSSSWSSSESDSSASSSSQTVPGPGAGAQAEIRRSRARIQGDANKPTYVLTNEDLPEHLRSVRAL